MEQRSKSCAKLGIGSALGVLTTVLIANSLLLAVLAKLGHKIDRLKVPFLRPVDDSEAAREKTLVARWGDADYSVVLYRSSYRSGLRLFVASRRLEALARTAAAEAARLDEREAPQREIARQKKETEDIRASEEKARLANKAVFRP